ncbi:MAG TPA: M6 family metalloprotease domain-containing protein [Candidatus Edwardsbacteria bacterium]|nr:M6 family metalloprotease domain-containing protein [Candidatus Edwardsbacteria bacterium]
MVLSAAAGRAHPGSGRWPAPVFPAGVEVPGPNRFKATRQLETVAVLVDFADNPADSARFCPARFDSMLYSTGIYTGQPYRQGSLRDFYLENSYGQFSVVGGVAGNGWFRSNYNYSRYRDGNYMLSKGYQLASENLQVVDQYVDFRQYDLDGNDTIDAMFMVHAGADGADDGNVDHCWSHAIPWFDYMTDDGVVIAGVTNVPEFALVGAARDTTMCCIATMSHELGHLAGLPDLYDYSRNTWGVGYWGLMGYGAWGAGGNTPWSPSHMEAWSKVTAGFVTPVVIARDTHDLRIVDVETHPVIYKVWRGGADGDTCFYLENRQRKGFDTPLPGAGLLIWHIDPSLGSDDDIVDLEEDSTFHLDHGLGVRPDPHQYHDTLGRDSDPLPGSWARTSFDDNSVPNSRDNNGDPTGVSIENVRLAGDTVICDVLVGINGVAQRGTRPASAQRRATAGPNPFRAALAIALPPAPRTTVSIYNCTGALVRRVNGRGGSLSWDGRDGAGRQTPSGLYLLRIEQPGFTQTLKVLRLK